MQTALILQSPSLTDRNSNVLAHFNLPAPVAGNNSLRFAVDSAFTLPAREKFWPANKSTMQSCPIWLLKIWD